MPPALSLTDTHCHLDLEQFDPDREAVLERAAQAGVDHMVVPGLSVASSKAVLRLVDKHACLFAAIGVHPTEAATWLSSSYADLRALVRNDPGNSGKPDAPNQISKNKIVAIGEIGLDYYWDSAPHELQMDILRQQLDLAAEMGLPVILHLREAREAPNEACGKDMLQILEKWIYGLRSSNGPCKENPGVLHSYSGTLETALTAIELGFFIGVSGPVTFTNARLRQEIISSLPLEKLLIETDAPFQAPHPNRGKRNEPAFVCLIADKIASLHGCSLEEVAKVTGENAARLFNW